jgi:hypothetical protein
MAQPPWAPSNRSPEAKTLYANAQAEQTRNPEAFTLNRNVILREHHRRFPDASPPAEGLLRLADEAGTTGQLNALGVRAIRRLLTALASKRDRFKEHAKAHPDVSSREVNAPIFIIGGWRTGSTLLHRALSATNALRGVKFWEWADPFTAADGTADEQARVVAGAEQSFNLQYTLNPLKRAVHSAGASMAEECVVGMGADGKNWALPSSVWAPEYTRWLASQEFSSSYATHRYMLQLLSGSGSSTGQRWILKAPAHTPELATLLSTYPDARVIHLHRDVLDVVASGANLFCVFQSTYSDNVDAKALGAFQLEILGEWFDRATKIRSNSVKSDQFLDINYRDLTADPIACIAKVLDWLEISPTVLNDAREFLQATPHDKSYRYGLDDFGLNEGLVRDRMATYSDYFDKHR